MNSKNVIRVVSYFSRMREENLLSLGQRLPGELCVGKFTSTDALAAATGLDCDYFMCGPNEWMTRLRRTSCAVWRRCQGASTGSRSARLPLAKSLWTSPLRATS